MRTLILIALLAGCTALPEVKTPTDALAVTIVTIDEISRLNMDAVESGRISPEAATHIGNLLHNAFALTGTAQAAIQAGKPESAMETLSLIDDLLAEIKRLIAGWKVTYELEPDRDIGPGRATHPLSEPLWVKSAGRGDPAAAGGRPG